MQHPDPTPPSRRDLLELGLHGASLLLLGSTTRAASPQSPDPDDLLDAALTRLHERVSTNDTFLSNHVPMCIDALHALGRADAIPTWIEKTLKPVPDDRESNHPITANTWRDALGDRPRFQDWRVFFLEALTNNDWKPVLRRWAPRFAPGLAGAATHGAIRTAHAVRALSGRDNQIRRVELATALAYWASRYEELPWDGTRAPKPNVQAALAEVKTRLPAETPPRGNIVTGLRSLGDTPSFASVAGLVDTQDPLRTLSEITSAFARIYLRNPQRRIHFTHAITAPSAVRLLAPYLDDESLEATTRYAWQAAAGLHAVYHDPRNEAPEPSAVPPTRKLVDLAVENGDAHAIKLTEACLREHAIEPDPVRLHVAHDAALHL